VRRRATLARGSERMRAASWSGVWCGSTCMAASYRAAASILHPHPRMQLFPGNRIIHFLPAITSGSIDHLPRGRAATYSPDRWTLASSVTLLTPVQNTDVISCRSVRRSGHIDQRNQRRRVGPPRAEGFGLRAQSMGPERASTPRIQETGPSTWRVPHQGECHSPGGTLSKSLPSAGPGRSGRRRSCPPSPSASRSSSGRATGAGSAWRVWRPGAVSARCCRGGRGRRSAPHQPRRPRHVDRRQPTGDNAGGPDREVS
jgi:hypothetical protein